MHTFLGDVLLAGFPFLDTLLYFPFPLAKAETDLTFGTLMDSASALYNFMHDSQLLWENQPVFIPACVPSSHCWFNLVFYG